MWEVFPLLIGYVAQSYVSYRGGRDRPVPALSEPEVLEARFNMYKERAELQRQRDEMAMVSIEGFNRMRNDRLQALQERVKLELGRLGQEGQLSVADAQLRAELIELLDLQSSYEVDLAPLEAYADQANTMSEQQIDNLLDDWAESNIDLPTPTAEEPGRQPPPEQQEREPAPRREQDLRTSDLGPRDREISPITAEEAQPWSNALEVSGVSGVLDDIRARMGKLDQDRLSEAKRQSDLDDNERSDVRIRQIDRDYDDLQSQLLAIRKAAEQANAPLEAAAGAYQDALRTYQGRLDAHRGAGTLPTTYQDEFNAAKAEYDRVRQDSSDQWLRIESAVEQAGYTDAFDLPRWVEKDAEPQESDPGEVRQPEPGESPRPEEPVVPDEEPAPVGDLDPRPGELNDVSIGNEVLNAIGIARRNDGTFEAPTMGWGAQLEAVINAQKVGAKQQWDRTFTGFIGAGSNRRRLEAHEVYVSKAELAGSVEASIATWLRTFEQQAGIPAGSISNDQGVRDYIRYEVSDTTNGESLLFELGVFPEAQDRHEATLRDLQDVNKEIERLGNELAVSRPDAASFNEAMNQLKEFNEQDNMPASASDLQRRVQNLASNNPQIQALEDRITVLDEEINQLAMDPLDREIARIKKADPAAYDAIARSLGLDPNDNTQLALYITNNPDRWRAAVSAHGEIESGLAVDSQGREVNPESQEMASRYLRERLLAEDHSLGLRGQREQRRDERGQRRDERAQRRQESQAPSNEADFLRGDPDDDGWLPTDEEIADKEQRERDEEAARNPGDDPGLDLGDDDVVIDPTTPAGPQEEDKIVRGLKQYQAGRVKGKQQVQKHSDIRSRIVSDLARRLGVSDSGA